MKNRIELLGCPINTLTMKETVEMINDSIVNNSRIHHVVVNAAKLVNMRKDAELKDSVINCDIINPDGQSVVWASHILGSPLPERVTGIDLMENLIRLSSEKGYKVFFLGAKEEVVRSVVARYSQEYSPDLIGGYRNGYFSHEEEEGIAKKIAESGSHILFVAISSPVKEKFLNKYKTILNTPFIMGVGGSFDVVSGEIKRAPLWMQKAGLEWFHRFLQEPKRMFKRNLYTNSAFIWLVIKEKFSSIFAV